MHRYRTAAALAATLAIAAALPASGALAADPTTTLRFAIVGGEDHNMAPYARDFIKEAAARSGGSIVVEPVWSAGGGSSDGSERGVARLLTGADADLALTASRAWDGAGITDLEALQAPFLITDDALAAAVSTSSTAHELLAGMANGGVTGLAMWPEDLEHFVNMPCQEPITAPDQLAGTTIRVAAPSAVTFDVVQTLGATPVFYNEYGADAAACKIHAVELGLHRAITLPGLPPYTGDVTLFPKFEVLAANSTAFDRLTIGQQRALREAAAAARDLAIAEYLPEADAAAAWCAKGGTVVLAGPDGIAAFEAALLPVTDRLMADPVTAQAIGAIRALKETVRPAPAAKACGTTVQPTTSARPQPDTTGYPGTLPPDGTYRADITAESLAAAGASPHFAERNGVLATLTFADGVTTWVANQDPPCYGDVTSDGSAFTITERVPDTCIGGSFEWRETPDGIALVWLQPTPGSWAAQDISDVAAFFDRDWTRIE